MGSPATPHLQVAKGSRDLILKFWDPLHISGTVRVTSNLARRLTAMGTNENRSKGVRKWSRDLL